MLKQRVLTAIVLLAVLLPALFIPWSWPFLALTLVMIGAGGWEWARLNGVSSELALAMGAALAVVCAGAWLLGWVGVGPNPVWWLACTVWVLGGAVALRVGPSAWPSLPRVARCVLGLSMLWAAWLAMASAKVVGVNYLMSVFCLVWTADIAAYAGGRAFGRNKLAPTISPGKSWEGVWSGAAGVMLLAVVWILADKAAWLGSPSVFTLLWQRFGLAGLVFGVVFLNAMSVIGDLVESLVKRAAGAKDSSQLLPGHGGVLDRVDALLPVFPIAMALSSF
jgi:phosphatidate cytidylyltransferase